MRICQVDSTVSNYCSWRSQPKFDPPQQPAELCQPIIDEQRVMWGGDQPIRDQYQSRDQWWSAVYYLNIQGEYWEMRTKELNVRNNKNMNFHEINEYIGKKFLYWFLSWKFVDRFLQYKSYVFIFTGKCS